jgi:hypothetical protein
VRRKVGVITSAEIVGRNLEVGGYLYAKDFPDIVEEVAKSGRGPSELRHERHQAPVMHGAIEQRQGTERARLRASLSAAVERIRSLTTALRRGPRADVTLPALRAEAEGTPAVGLGMSYEVTDVLLADRRARVWTLMKVTFTGAAILRKNKAAYQDTWIELST